MRKPKLVAQQTPPSDPVPPAAASPPADAAPPAPAASPTDSTVDDEAMRKLMEEEAKKVEVITIHETGTLIDRTELITPAPISVINHEDIQATGLVTTGDILQKLPSQGGAINSNVNNGGDGSTRIALRNLGSARTLVLLNGRRIVNSGTGGDLSVDLNTIPTAIIERIEVLKDGASAIYGSDAIGGVVNIITRKDFTGQEVSAQTGTTQHADGTVYDVNFVTGAGNDRGNVIFSGGYSKQGSVFAGDRDFSRFDFSAPPGGFLWHPTDGAGAPLPPMKNVTPGGSQATLEGRLGAYTTQNGQVVPRQGNALWQSEVLANCVVTDPKTPPPCTRDPITGAWRNFGPTDVYNYQPENYLFTPLERYNLFSQGGYKLTDKVHLFFEGSYMNRSSSQQLAPEPLTLDPSTPISKDSIYNPYGLDITSYRRRLAEFGDRATDQNINTFRVVAGFDGELPENDLLKNWKWEVSANYGRSEATQKNNGNLILSHLANELGPSFMDAQGVAHCGTPDAPIDGCVPLDILSGAAANKVAAGAKSYATFTGVASGFNQEQVALGTLHGPLFKLPNNGVVSLAVGADYRRESAGYSPDPLTATGDTTGNQISPITGSYNVVEGFGELEVVPIADKPWARWLEFDFAARGFDYNTFGSGVTWKAGALYKTEGGVSLRGTYSSAFRAPQVSELYGGQSDSFPPAVDPCDLSRGGSLKAPYPPLDPVVAAKCAAEGVPDGFISSTGGQQRSRVGGNPDLKAETAKTYTFGAVWEPTFFNGFSTTLDYFHIHIDDAIQPIGATIILGDCYNANPTQCEKITRDPTTHEIDSITDINTNLSSFETSGVDFAIAYDYASKKAGHFRFTLLGTYLLSINENIAGVFKDGYNVYDLSGGAGANPTLKANLGITWGKGGLVLGANGRFISGFTECEGNDCSDPMAARRSVDAYMAGDVFAGYTFKTAALGTTNFQVGVNNITDTTPPYIANAFYANSDATTYDYIGRFFYTRLTQSF